MIISCLAVLLGLIALVWSADHFVDGAVGVARFCGMSTFMIGMIIVGFGTSAPEMVVSAISAFQNNPELALGNAYGSNIANIALILGVTAIIKPIAVQKIALKRDLPILMIVTILAFAQAFNLSISRFDGILLIVVFLGVMIINVITEKKTNVSSNEENESPSISFKKSLFWLIFGLVVLVGSSRLLVWGAVEIAKYLGVSDLLIGLTIIAVGTSLPELASSIVAAKKGENDLALGNIVGSNLFNTLAVVGIASIISPMKEISPSILYRDLPVVLILTLLLFVFGISKKKDAKHGRINRIEGLVFVLIYTAYLVYLIWEAIKN